MSETTVLAIYPNEKVEELFELKNAWGSAPVIWTAMAQKYLNASFTYHIHGNELWDLWKDKAIPLAHRAVHVMTFDRAYIVKQDFQRAVQDIRTFLNDFPQPSNHVNHWFAIADYLETNPDIPAVGFHMTSVSDSPFQGEWNEEKEEHEPPNWDDCYSVYGLIDELESEAQE
ncbi:TPA: hypothetical protein ACSBZ9_002357 [Acinetobacter baumannii]